MVAVGTQGSGRFEYNKILHLSLRMAQAWLVVALLLMVMFKVDGGIFSKVVVNVNVNKVIIERADDTIPVDI